jgi:hypothetical protein
MKTTINEQAKDDEKSDAVLIRILQVIMVSGLLLILLGIYFHNYSSTIANMGVTGMVISACTVSIGMIMSLPTKMYLTFVLIKREQDKKAAHTH